jgi:hypothetical protein
VILLTVLIILIKIQSVSIIEALQYPMIATTQTNYINTIHTNIMDGKYDVAEKKEKKR